MCVCVCVCVLVFFTLFPPFAPLPLNFCVFGLMGGGTGWTKPPFARAMLLPAEYMCFVCSVLYPSYTPAPGPPPAPPPFLHESRVQ